MTRPYKFKVHFNRINMQRGNPNVWTCHIAGKCVQVPELKIEVPITTVFKPNGPQPRAYFVGEGFLVTEGGMAVIHD